MKSQGRSSTYACFDVFECTFITPDFHQFHRATFVGHETDEFANEIAHEFHAFAFALEWRSEIGGKVRAMDVLDRDVWVERVLERIFPIYDLCEDRWRFHV